jgi:hypothetical protein
LKELLPGTLHFENDYVDPPMAKVLKGCPTDTCLRYGQATSQLSPKSILDDDTVNDISALFLNSSSVPINGTNHAAFE